MPVDEKTTDLSDGIVLLYNALPSIGPLYSSMSLMFVRADDVNSLPQQSILKVMNPWIISSERSIYLTIKPPKILHYVYLCQLQASDDAGK